ncbi:LysR family transcriptional regulator [Streptomyces sp. NPDC002701]|uniref:LysR family transcriptional regulator n=1 Tax=Streptomyces sp. NPDC002701 TaxID=3364661 RepID=UPI0036C97AC2
MATDRELLRRLDLNLLVAFDVLMDESNVSRAAERMSVGQPAMSASLARLRRFFGDPLLVRQGRSLVPTSRALMLVEPIREALNSIESTLNAGRHFDPLTSTRTFRLMASDYVLLLLLGPLLVHLSDEAPNVRFQIHPLTADHAELIERSQLDLLVYPDELMGENVPLRSSALFTDRIVCAVANDHPEVGEVMTEEQFRTLPCVSFGGSPTDTISDLRFRQLGIDRPVAIRAQSFVVQPLLLPGSRLITPLPERLGRYLIERIDIRLVDPPVPLAPLCEAMFWSPRSDTDPAHQWLRKRLSHAAAQLD